MEATTELDRRSEPALPRGVDLESHVPALLVILGSKLGLHASRQSARQHGLDLTEWRIMQILGSEGRSSIIHIADLIGIDRGGASRAIARLEDRGILARYADSSDRRKSLVELTAEGGALFTDISRFALQREERLLRRLAPSERVLLRRMLNALIDEADQLLEENWSA